MLYSTQKIVGKAIRVLIESDGSRRNSHNRDEVPNKRSQNASKSEGLSVSKIGHNVATRIKSTDNFDEKIGDDIYKFIDIYLDACGDYEL